MSSPSSMMTSLWSEVSDQGHSSVLQGSLVTAYQDNHVRIAEYNPYVQSIANRALLQDVGINSLNVGIDTHSHPGSKALETYLLVEDLAPLLDKPTTAWFMKRAKAQRLANKSGQPVTLDNPVLTLRDFTRYPDATARQPRPVETPLAVMHDALHHMTAADLLHLFEMSPSLETMYATVVYPPELLMGSTVAAWPSLYTFLVRDDRLFYFPDGVQTEAYEQPANLDWLMRSSTICSGNLTLGVEMVRSYYSHHLFVISRHAGVIPTTRPFPAPDRVEVPSELMPGVPYAGRLVPRVLAKQLTLFALGVSKANQAQIYSRARALVGDFKVQADIQAVMTVVQVACSLHEERPVWSPSVSVMRSMMPKALRFIFLPHDLWRGLTWTFFHNFCKGLDMPAATNLVDLRPYYLRAGRDHLSALFTGIHNAPTYRSTLDLLHAIGVGEDIGDAARDDNREALLAAAEQFGEVQVEGGSGPSSYGPAVPFMHSVGRSIVTMGLLASPWDVVAKFLWRQRHQLEPVTALHWCLTHPRSAVAGFLIAGPLFSVCFVGLRIVYDKSALAAERFARGFLSAALRSAIHLEFNSVADVFVKIGALFNPRFGYNSRLGLQMVDNARRPHGPIVTLYPSEEQSPRPNWRASGPAPTSDLQPGTQIPRAPFMDPGLAAAAAVPLPPSTTASPAPSIDAPPEPTDTDAPHHTEEANPFPADVQPAPLDDIQTCVSHRNTVAMCRRGATRTDETPAHGRLPREPYEPNHLLQSFGMNELVTVPDDVTYANVCLQTAALVGGLPVNGARVVMTSLFYDYIDTGFRRLHARPAVFLSEMAEPPGGARGLQFARPIDHEFSKADLHYISIHNDVEMVPGAPIYETLKRLVPGTPVIIDSRGDFDSAKWLVHHLSEVGAPVRYVDPPLRHPLNLHYLIYVHSWPEDLTLPVFDRFAPFKMRAVYVDFLLQQYSQIIFAWNFPARARAAYKALLEGKEEPVEGGRSVSNPCPTLISRLPLFPRTNTCLFEAAQALVHMSMADIWCIFSRHFPDRAKEISMTGCMTNETDVHDLGVALGCRFHLRSEDLRRPKTLGESGPLHVLFHFHQHWSAVPRVSFDAVNNARDRSLATAGHRSRSGHAGTNADGLAKRLIQCSRQNKRMFPYVPSAPRARALFREIETGDVGLLLPKDEALLKAMDSVTKFPGTRRPIKILGRMGLPGSRKSSDYKRVLAEHMERFPNDTSFRVITFTDILRREWLEEVPVGTRSWLVPTWEMALQQAGADVLIFDDVGMFPPGYIDLFLLLRPWVRYVFFTGCPLQEQFHSRKACSVLNTSSEASHVAPYASEYIMETWRVANGVARELGLPSRSTKPGALLRTQLPRTGCLNIVPLALDATRHGAQTSGEAVTYRGCQGLTRPEICLEISDNCLKMDPASLFTALTRSEGNVWIFDCLTPSGRSRLHANPFLKAVVTGKGLHSAVAAHIAANLPERLRDVRNLLQGGRHDKLDHLPHLRFDIPEYPGEDPVIEEDVDTSFVPDRAPTSLPPAEQAYLDALILSPLRAKYMRESFVAREQEFTDQAFDGIDDWRAIFLKHNNRDAATVEWSYKYRLRSSTPEEKRSRMRAQAGTGAALFKAFLSATKLPQRAWDPKLYEMCREENEDTHLARDLKQLLANEGRSDGGWPIEKVQLLLKNQAIKKLEKMGSDAKPGQPIACFRAQVILRLGALGRYLARTMKADMPEHIYLHTRTTDDDLDAFTADWNFDIDSTDNDHKAYDQSQTEEFLVFEQMMMRYYQVPEDLIEFYVWIKMNCFTFLGPLAIMRITGEWCTWLFNTIGNIAYTHLKFNIPWGTKQAYSGDDSTINAHVCLRPGWKRWEPMFTLESKPNRSKRPTFCGWRFTPFGIIKDPLLIFARTQYCLAAGTFPAAAPNYYLELRHALRLGDALYDILTADELEMTQSLQRTFIKARDGIPALKRVMELYPFW